MNVTIRHAEADDIEPCGRIIYEAFAHIDRQHGFAPTFATVAAGVARAANCITHPSVFGIVAERDGHIIGSAFMSEHDPVRGIGPVTVDPVVHARGVGRRLMDTLIERGGDAVSLRLVQAAYNSASLSLYASLGFEVKEPLVTMQGRVGMATEREIEVQPASTAHLDACADICARVIGLPRTKEIADALSLGEAFVALRSGHVVAYTTGLSQGGHSVATDEAAMAALIAGVLDASDASRTFFLPVRQAELFRWCLTTGLRVERPWTLMARGEYRNPNGCFLPSILY